MVSMELFPSFYPGPRHLAPFFLKFEILIIQISGGMIERLEIIKGEVSTIEQITRGLDIRLV